MGSFSWSVYSSDRHFECSSGQGSWRADLCYCDRFFVAILLALLVSVVFGKSSLTTQNLQNLAPFDFGAGLIVAFYVISATVLAPKIGVANFIVMAVSSQILFSLMIDHFGLFGAPVKPVNMAQLFGAVMLLIGLATTQLASSKLD